MNTTPSRATPMVDAITTLVERWVSQDAARVNAARAASRLHQRRREVEDVTHFLAAHQRQWTAGVDIPTSGDPNRAQRRSSRSP